MYKLQGLFYRSRLGLFAEGWCLYLNTSRLPALISRYWLRSFEIDRCFFLENVSRRLALLLNGLGDLLKDKRIFSMRNTRSDGGFNCGKHAFICQLNMHIFCLNVDPAGYRVNLTVLIKNSESTA